ncbi:MAG: cation-translocating P-type ATPase [Bacteroidetes bacterium]|nr:cation-translocating P-type ATPase [Bacteroidota bacterium]
MMSIGKNKQLDGLDEGQAKLALQQNGYNELPSTRTKSSFSIILGVLKEPMFILLISCGTLYILLGDVGEGLMLMASVVIIIIITFYQEKKTERALEALRELSSPRALVIRNGKEKRIAGREVVVGDLVIVQEGDRVCADAIIIDALNLKIDESLLTGESVAVRKSEWDGKSSFAFPSGDNSAFVYSGTLVIQGHGIATVIATGMNTQFGKIGKSIEEVKEEPTLLQKETGQIVKTFSIIGFGVCILLIIVFGITRNDWLHGILAGLSLAMAMLPEEFAVVLTIFMAMGAWRMSKKNVLTRKAASIETLGAVTVLCADKTGTLTQNKMSVRKLFAGRKFLNVNEEAGFELPEEFHQLVEYAILASQRSPFDPMERAFLNLGERKLAGTGHLHNDWKLEKEYPLSAELLAMSHIFKAPGENEFVIAAKGSPEAIADLCHFTASQSEELKMNISALASEGLRVLGVARGLFSGSGNLPAQQHDFNFEFIGLVGLEDPLRESVKQDLELCYKAGIRVIMITGDYPVTAQNIARRMGLKNAGEVITGDDLGEMNELVLREKIRTTNIFARVVPEQKLMIVNALKDNGEIVAMTGDGVNDAPALKAAHVGISMGQRGSDVAREASSLVLLDDNFSSVISAIRMGRRIYDNMQKAMSYIFSVHVPIAGLTLIPVLFFHLPIILFPLHIAFLELIIDPACSLIFEGEEEEKDIMDRQPRKTDQPVFGVRRIVLSSLQGISVLIFSLAVYLFAMYLQRPEDEIRALTFTTLIIANIGLILVNRSHTRTIIETFREKNTSVKWVVGGAAGFLLSVLFIPSLRKLFHFDILHSDDLLICFLAGTLSIMWLELIKVFNRRRSDKA